MAAVSRAYRKSHTPRQQPAVLDVGMDQIAPVSAAARRTRWTVIVGLAFFGLAIATFVPVRALPRILAMPLHQRTSFVWFETVNGVALMSVLALPLAVLTAWALAHRRRAAGVPLAWRLSLAEVGIVYGTVPWVWIVMLAGGRVSALSLIPLRDLLTMPLSQVVGNMLIFAALGFFAPIRFAALASVPRILALAAVCSIVIETTQYFLPDRISSVDDVLLNAAGAGLAALASRAWWRTPAPVAVPR
jgi:hypothetical protein